MHPYNLKFKNGKSDGFSCIDIGTKDDKGEM